MIDETSKIYKSIYFVRTYGLYINNNIIIIIMVENMTKIPLSTIILIIIVCYHQ